MSLASPLLRGTSEIAWPVAACSTSKSIALATDTMDAIDRVSWEQVQARPLVGVGDTFDHFQWADRIPWILKISVPSGHRRRHG